MRYQEDLRDINYIGGPTLTLLGLYLSQYETANDIYFFTHSIHLGMFYKSFVAVMEKMNELARKISK